MAFRLHLEEASKVLRDDQLDLGSQFVNSLCSRHDRAYTFKGHVTELRIGSRLQVQVEGQVVVIDMEGEVRVEGHADRLAQIWVAPALHAVDEGDLPPDAAGHLPGEAGRRSGEAFVRLRHDLAWL
jgi:hypothetical protein